MAEGGSKDEGRFTLADNSEFVFDFYCEVCRDDDKHLEAAGYCVDCEEYLCGTCVSSHKRARPSRYHKILDDTEMPKDKPLTQDRRSKDIHTTCKAHSGDSVQYYCKTHDEFGCSSCFVIGHRGCSGITRILQVADKLLDDKEFQSFTETLAGIRQRVTVMIEQTHNNISHLEQSRVDAIREVEEFRQKLNEVLDGLEVHFIGEVEAAAAEEIKAIESFENKLQCMFKKIEAISFEIDHLLNSSRMGQLFIAMKQSEEKIGTLNKDLMSAEESDVRKTIRFQPNKSLQGLLQKIDAFGEVCVNHPDANKPNTQKVKSTVGCSRRRHQHARNKKRSYKTDLELRIDLDELLEFY